MYKLFGEYLNGLSMTKMGGGAGNPSGWERGDLKPNVCQIVVYCIIILQPNDTAFILLFF